MSTLPGKLSTHVLDTTNGVPGVGMRVDFSVREGEQYRLVATVHTNADGRTDAPLMLGDTMRTGQFELLFYVADYYRARGTATASTPFLDRVPVHFGIADARADYHVPLVCTPWSYSTYRGS